MGNGVRTVYYGQNVSVVQYDEGVSSEHFWGKCQSSVLWVVVRTVCYKGVSTFHDWAGNITAGACFSLVWRCLF